MSIDDLPTGIHQSQQLVERFKNILSGMSKKNDEDVIFTHNTDQAASFPYNELHHDSPFEKLIDWEPLLEKMTNKSEKKAGLMLGGD